MSGSAEADRAAPTRWRRRVPFGLFLLFAVLAAGMGAAGYLYHQHGTRQFEEAARRQLVAIADLKVTQIARWRAERIGDGEILRANPELTRAIRRLVDGPPQAELPRELAVWLALFTRHYDYENLMLLDRQGRPRFSLERQIRPLDPPCAAAAEEAMRTTRVSLSDLYRTGAPARNHLCAAFPVMPPGGGAAPLGTILAQIDPHRFFYPLLESWPTPSPTAEALVVRREGDHVVYLNELRHLHDTALRLTLPVIRNDLPAAMAALGREGIVAGRDYRGVPVLAAVKKVPNSPWYLVAKVDAEEIYAPLHKWVGWIVLVWVLLLAGAAATAGLLWRHQRARFYRQQYEAEVQAQAALEHSRQQLRALAARLFSAQEDERRRLSRELHDDLNQRLAVLAMQVDSLQQQTPALAKPVRRELATLQDQLGALSDEIRRLAYQLHPSILEHLGLAVALRSCCAESSTHEGIPVRFEAENVPESLPLDVALCLYRVTQEALRNLARHSRAGQGTVRLVGTGEGLELSIADDGAGFDPAGAKAKGGLGLISMEERVRLGGGSLSVDSRPGEGTRLKVRMPLAEPPA
jgi:signal transduction histidine kinase